MKRLITCCLTLFTTVIQAHAADIAWISYHPDDVATAPAQPHGFVEAAGQEYVDLLRDNGHAVTRFEHRMPDAAHVQELNMFDLVVSSRQVASGNYDTDEERELWHGITAPMMFMSGYVLRNNRLQFVTGDTIPDHGNQGPVTLHVEQRSHPIFQGITLDASNNMQFATYPVTTPIGGEQRGISVNGDPLNGGGTLLGTVGTEGDATLGNLLIAHWPAGDQLGSFTLAAPRMVFLSGSREADGTPIDAAGLYDLTPGGTQLFLNSVCFLVGGCGPPLVDGDTDGNGTVNLADFEPIRANFRKPVTARNQGDLVTNGVVDFADFREWKAAFTGAGGSLAGLDLSLGTNVPEPSTLGLLSLAVCGLAGKWRKRRGVVG